MLAARQGTHTVPSLGAFVQTPTPSLPRAVWREAVSTSSRCQRLGVCGCCAACRPACVEAETAIHALTWSSVLNVIVVVVQPAGGSLLAGLLG